MENVENTISFSTSYEIQKFNEICAELLILDKVFPNVEDPLENPSTIDVKTIDVSKENKVVNETKAVTEVKKVEVNLLDAKKQKELQSSLMSIWNLFIELIKRQKEEAEATLSQADLKSFNEVIFISVALIDEFFMRKQKYVYEFWKRNLLEFYFFKTRSAGEIFYQNIDDIIQKNNILKKNIAFIYLQALSLGFKGKYFHHEKRNDIVYYKKSIYSFLFNKNMYMIDETNSPALRNGEHIFENTKAKGLSSNGKIYFFIFVLITLYLIITYFIWSQKVSNLEIILRRLGTPMELIVK